MKGGQVYLLLLGPAVLAILVGILALTALCAAAWGRADRLAALAERAAGRLGARRLVPPLWGLAATVLILALSVLLFQTKVLALLGLLVLLAGLWLAALGVGVAALRLGRSLASACGQLAPAPLAALGLGLTTLLFASLLPVAGWLAAGLAAAAGLGAVLEALLSRR